MSDASTNPHDSPREGQRTPTRRAVVVDLLVAAVVVWVGNLALERALLAHPSGFSERLIRAKWRLLERPPEPRPDLLILGDSSGNQGVSPAVLSARLGARAVNLCTVGDLLLVGDAWMLEEWLARGPAPRAVLLVHVYDVWQRAPNPTPVAMVPRSWGFWTERAPALEFDGVQTERMARLRVSPVHASSPETITEALFGSLPRGPALDATGFMAVETTDPPRVLANTRSHLAAVRARSPWMSNANREALERIGWLAARHDFDVHLVMAPVHDALATDPAWRAHVAALRGIVTSAIAPNPRLKLALWEPVSFPLEDLADSSDHLRANAAVRFTERVAEALER